MSLSKNIEVQDASSEVGIDMRCMCGNLMARRVESGIELRCRRCKRTLLIAFDESGECPIFKDEVD